MSLTPALPGLCPFDLAVSDNLSPIGKNVKSSQPLACFCWEEVAVGRKTAPPPLLQLIAKLHTLRYVLPASSHLLIENELDIKGYAIALTNAGCFWW